MRRFLPVYVTAILISSISSCTLKKELPAPDPFTVTHVSPFEQQGDAQGVYYALPRTVITVDFEVTRHDFVHGPFAHYAAKYLGLSNVQQVNSSTYDITDIRISTYVEPDPGQFYFIRLPEQNGKLIPFMLQLSESGLIQGFNEFNESSLSQSASFSAVGRAGEGRSTFKYFADFNLTERVDTVVEYISIDTLRIPQRVVRKTMVEKSPDQRAKDAADEIFRIQESKMNLLTGFQEVPYEFETFQFMYEKLDKMEEELLKLFTGQYYTHKQSYRYSYTPDANEFALDKPIFRFSRLHGIISMEQPYGELMYVNVVRAHNTRNVEQFAASSVNQVSTGGLFYRIPEYATFRIRHGQELKAESRFLVSQFGLVTTLPPHNLDVRFHPETGGVENVSSGN